LYPEAHPALKVAICSSGSSDNYQHLNVFPTQMVQSADVKSDHTNRCELMFKYSFNSTVRVISGPQVGIVAIAYSISIELCFITKQCVIKNLVMQNIHWQNRTQISSG
jgi:hypothetical protein